MSVNVVVPFFGGKAFNCPHCSAYSAMSWVKLNTDGGFFTVYCMAKCHRCENTSVWDSSNRKLIFPGILSAPLPSEDLPESCMVDYMEARSIANESPKGAAALLRLCVQKLAMHLGGEGKNINQDIGLLVQNGLPRKVQQALDVVRVVGNNAVHPGEINIDDNPETVNVLFGLINLIVENQITQDKLVTNLFDSLPEGARLAVEKRDNG